MRQEQQLLRQEQQLQGQQLQELACLLGLELGPEPEQLQELEPELVLEPERLQASELASGRLQPLGLLWCLQQRVAWYTSCRRLRPIRPRQR